MPPIYPLPPGEREEAGLLALAVDIDKKTETHGYLGLDCILKGRKDEALAHYRWVKEHGRRPSPNMKSPWPNLIGSRANRDRLPVLLRPSEAKP
jgi:hypothetical protein